MEFPYASFFIGTQVFAEGFPLPQLNREHGLQPFEGCLPVVPDEFVEGVLDENERFIVFAETFFFYVSYDV